MSQPRWDPDERRWMLDDEHSSDAPRRRRAPITDQRPSSGIDVREFDARVGRGSMTVAELTHADLDEDRDPRFGSRDHDRRGSRDEQGFDDRWTPDVPRPSTPGRNGFRDVAEAAVDRWRDEEAGYGPGRYDSHRYGADTTDRDLTGRYSDARYVRDVLDAGRDGSYRDGGSRAGDGRFDADVLGWGRTSAYGADARDLDDHASVGRDGGRYGTDALDPAWRVPSDHGTDHRDALDTGADGRYPDPYADDPYAGRTRNGAFDNGAHGAYRNGSDRSVPTNGRSGRDDVDRYEDDRYEPRDADRNGRDRHDTGRYAPYELDRRDAGYLDGHAHDGDDPFHGGRNGMSRNGMSRNGMSRNGNGRSVRNDLDVDRGEAARIDDGPYGYAPAEGRTDRHDAHHDAHDGAYDTGGRRNGVGRVDRVPYSRPRRAADGYEPDPRDEYDERAYDDGAYDDGAYDDRAYEDRADGGRNGHVVDDGYGTDPGGPTVGGGRAARRRARELEEDRTETREFGLPADEAADLDASEDPDGEPTAVDGAVEDGEGGTRRKRRRRWPWVVGGVAVAGGLAVPVVLALQDGAQGDSVSSVTVDSAGFGTGPASPVNGNPDAPAAGQVVYQLTGSGTASTVTYGRGTSISQVSGAQLPWEQTMPGGNGGSEYTLTATSAQGSDEISCRISVDGAVIAEQKASGDYAAVSCTGRR